MDRNWKDDFNFDDYDDYKVASCEWERLRQKNSINGWIYVGLDTRYDNMAKIGFTTGQLGTRASGSQNPFYALLYAFKIKEGVTPVKVGEIESAVIALLCQYYERIRHKNSGRLSEWFYVNPCEMSRLVHDFLYEKYSGEMYCCHCFDRDIGVIFSWENKKLLSGAPRNPYQANDLSSPPVDFACYMPGGCGADCNCWD
ncbi:GIY-YIG nuclease family protein [Alloalcanivorax venustensis]|uniref:GIY-YIG nuclease family protein n=1 Tax=Alloalcanivorax venustensis TaxID=172371 RepID=UPI0035142C42